MGNPCAVSISALVVVLSSLSRCRTRERHAAQVRGVPGRLLGLAAPATSLALGCLGRTLRVFTTSVRSRLYGSGPGSRPGKSLGTRCPPVPECGAQRCGVLARRGGLRRRRLRRPFRGSASRLRSRANAEPHHPVRFVGRAVAEGAQPGRRIRPAFRRLRLRVNSAPLAAGDPTPMASRTSSSGDGGSPEARNAGAVVILAGPRACSPLGERAMDAGPAGDRGFPDVATFGTSSPRRPKRRRVRRSRVGAPSEAVSAGGAGLVPLLYGSSSGPSSELMPSPLSRNGGFCGGRRRVRGTLAAGDLNAMWADLVAGVSSGLLASRERGASRPLVTTPGRARRSSFVTRDTRASRDGGSRDAFGNALAIGDVDATAPISPCCNYRRRGRSRRVRRGRVLSALRQGRPRPARSYGRRLDRAFWVSPIRVITSALSCR